MKIEVEDIDLLKISNIFTCTLQKEVSLILKKHNLTQNLVGFFKGETHLHTARVALFSDLIAKKRGLSDNLRNKLVAVAPFHDFGKLCIVEEILNKPSKLTEKEFSEVKKHCEFGHKLLSNNNNQILDIAAIVAYQHHEKYDGSGYPQGLQGEQIHLFARIVAVADVLDSLISQRPYKKGWKKDKVRAFFEKERGKHFDPIIVDLVLEDFDRFFYLCNV